MSIWLWQVLLSEFSTRVASFVLLKRYDFVCILYTTAIVKKEPRYGNRHRKMV